MLQGKIKVGYGLRFDALRGIHNEQGALAGCDGSGDLVGEIHVAGSINQIQNIVLIIKPIIHLDRMAFDGDTPFTFQIHVVEGLGLKIPVLHRVGDLE